ncbi:peptidase S28 [Stereum hirsutum FP-91666 SS1]|uniref:peptidase S28 n=1 Tax=Stereum hirsutum (strain FP-91666) TaxID=721885 RepID=UPI000444A055|nr:peptidase S28 [Stereum hirsutum FP-91666 SS1]EIM81403.1 peptidase S28 [Stereum hirsutum FP-91666 SS1]
MLLPLTVSLVVAAQAIALDAPRGQRLHNAQSVNLWKRTQARSSVAFDSENLEKRTKGEVGKRATFPQYNFTQPLDHFYGSTNGTFPQRYWVSTRHYTPGSNATVPVIVLDGGETSGEDRLPYLDTGIVDILAEATGGVGVVLEHRYYGDSVGVPDFSTDNLRWLNNEQALEDSANFMRNVKFEGIDEDLTAPGTPWIYFGGSYAGARAAHMKVLYPDIVYGAIASSGVTHAAITNWEYMDVIRQFATVECSDNLVQTVSTVDKYLGSNNETERSAIKAIFGLEDLPDDKDFASVLETPLEYWQSKNWDPAVGSTVFDDFCTLLNNETTTTSTNGSDSVTVQGLEVNNALVNYAGWIKDNLVAGCTGTNTIEQCFGTQDESQYNGTDLYQTWRLWTFQYCTQWGYLTTAPPSDDIPAIISRVLDLEYEHKICEQAFAPGEFFTVPPLPNVTSVNVLGDFGIAADRLAIVDGEIDPWRPDTPHSQYGAQNRTDTVLRPFKLIPNAVHHYDENGLANHSAEPPEIQAIHEQEVEFVKAWLEDWVSVGA